MLRRLLLALVALAPATLLAAEAVCPLPEADVDKATKAFGEMMTVFRDPRCANCHGAVNPFSGTGGHAGGRISLTPGFQGLAGSPAGLTAALTSLQGVPPTEAALADAMAALRTFLSADPPLTDNRTIMEVLKLGGAEPLATYPCMECHANQPAPWQLATSLWAGKSAEDLCAFFQSSMDPGDFLGHVTEDRLGLVQAGFAGTRGLTPFGRGVLKQEAGRDYAPEPVRGMSAAAFTAAANRWLDGLGGQFHKPPSCGCAVRNYRLVIKGQVGLRVASSGGVGTQESRSDHVIDLSFDREGRFSGQSRGTVPISQNMTAPGVSCRGELVIDQTVDVSGRIDEKTGELGITLTSSGVSRPSVQVCQVPGRTVRNQIPSVRSDPQTFEIRMPALVDAPKTISIPLGAGSMTGEIRILRR